MFYTEILEQFALTDRPRSATMADFFSGAPSKAPKSATKRSPKPYLTAEFQLLKVYSGGVADDNIKRAARILINPKLTTDEKLWKIDEIMPLPATASAEQLGKMLGVTKQAVLKTTWWKVHRKGKKADEIGHRGARHAARAAVSDPGFDDEAE